MSDDVDRYTQLYGHIDGPTNEERTEALRRGREKRFWAGQISRSTQSSGALRQMTPRLSKHRHGWIGGVPIK